MRITQHLHLEVLDPWDIAFEEHVGAAEGGLRFAARFADAGEQLRSRMHDPHAATTTAEARLDDQRKPDRRRRRQRRLIACDGGLGARHGRHTGLGRQALRRRLVAEGVELFRRRSDEPHTGRLQAPGELGALRQEAVTGMDGIGPDRKGELHQRFDVQVGANRLAAALGPNQERFIRLEPVQRETIFVAVDSHGTKAEFAACTQAANGDLRAIGNQQLRHDASVRS